MIVAGGHAQAARSNPSPVSPGSNHLHVCRRRRPIILAWGSAPGRLPEKIIRALGASNCRFWARCQTDRCSRNTGDESRSQCSNVFGIIYLGRRPQGSESIRIVDASTPMRSLILITTGLPTGPDLCYDHQRRWEQGEGKRRKGNSLPSASRAFMAGVFSQPSQFPREPESLNTPENGFPGRKHRSFRLTILRTRIIPSSSRLMAGW